MFSKTGFMNTLNLCISRQPEQEQEIENIKMKVKEQIILI